MRERPILFSAPMVRGLLDGSKTQTRRLLKPQPAEFTPHIIDIGGPYFDEDEGRWGQIKTEWSGPSSDLPMGEPMHEVFVPLPIRVSVGDRLWVREAWRGEAVYDDTPPRDIEFDACMLRYEADGSWSDHDAMTHAGKLRPSRFMPRWASRLTLLVTDVRVQRLQEISEADAEAEGPSCHVCGGQFPGESDCHCFHRQPGRIDFEALWDSLNAKRAPWDSNPWVIALTFEVQRGNIDAPANREAE